MATSTATATWSWRPEGARPRTRAGTKARARTATSAERPALWKTMAAIWPAYEDYQARTAREIPVVIIERA
jgi:hypothetical protein